MVVPRAKSLGLGDVIVGECTKGWTRDQWVGHFRTRDYIGASEVAAIMGLSPYAGPYTIWSRCTGRFAGQTDNRSMRMGRSIERFIIEEFARETGLKVSPVPYVLRHRNVHALGCNLDAGVFEVRPQGGQWGGELTATVDAKNVTFRLRREFAHWAETGEVLADSSSETYALQLHAHMAVTGVERAYLAVLCDRDLIVCQLERDEDIAAWIADFVDRWWARHIEGDEAPTPNDADLDAAKNFVERTDTEIQLPELEDLADRRFELKALIKASAAEVDAIDAQIIAASDVAKRIW